MLATHISGAGSDLDFNECHTHGCDNGIMTMLDVL